MNVLVSPLLFVNMVALLVIIAFIIVLILSFKLEKQMREIRFISFLAMNEETWRHLDVVFFHELN